MILLQLNEITLFMSKKLYRKDKEKMIGGVCAGIADYLNIDPVIIRIIFIIALLTEGFGLIIYIILWIILPSKDSKKGKSNEVVEENTEEIIGEIKEITKGLKKEIKSDTKKN
jgi:phage shock protein C